MEKKYRLSIGARLTLVIMFVFCMDLTASHSLSAYGGISANGWGRSVAQVFFLQTLEESKQALRKANTRKDEDITLTSHNGSDRHRLRWVYLSFLDSVFSAIRNLAESQNRFSVGIVFLYLYSVVFGAILFSTYMGLRRILILLGTWNASRATYLSAFSHTLVLSFVFFLHWRGGEYRYSVVEGFLVIAAVYFILRNTRLSLLLYGIVCIIAPLVRESGLFISLFLTTYYVVVDRRLVTRSLIFPALAVGSLLIANFDIIRFVFEYGFLFSFEALENQTTWHDLFRFRSPGPVISVFYNFAVFLVPIIIFYERGHRIKLYFLIIILGYFGILLIGTPIEHMSPRYMPALLLIIYAYAGDDLKIGLEKSSY